MLDKRWHYTHDWLNPAMSALYLPLMILHHSPSIQGIMIRFSNHDKLGDFLLSSCLPPYYLTTLLGNSNKCRITNDNAARYQYRL
jgi:hypothetical protein